MHYIKGYRGKCGHVLLTNFQVSSDDIVCRLPCRLVRTARTRIMNKKLFEGEKVYRVARTILQGTYSIKESLTPLVTRAC